MKKEILTQIRGRYDPADSYEDLLLEKISYLLTSDVGYHLIESFKRSVLNDAYDAIHCNMHRLEKNGDIILISDNYIEDDEERLQWAVEIKQDELVNVLDQWAEICETMLPYLVISREGDRVTLKACQTLDEVNAL